MSHGKVEKLVRVTVSDSAAIPTQAVWLQNSHLNYGAVLCFI